MSCGCNQNTAQPINYCDPECAESQISNFIAAFVGTLVKTSVNGRCVWTLPCDLGEEIPAYPRLPNEGALCYLYRIIALGSAIGEANTASNLGGVGLFASKVGVDLQFKGLQEGEGILLTVGANTITISKSWADVPASDSDTGTAGQEAYDANFHYICVATDTWRRTPLAGGW